MTTKPTVKNPLETKPTKGISTAGDRNYGDLVSPLVASEASGLWQQLAEPREPAKDE